MSESRIPVVLLPGFMLDTTLWDELASYLPAAWTLHRATLEGGDTIEAMARHIAAEAPERFVLVGFSLGGYVARQIAAHFPDRVAALVLIASSLREDTEQQAQLKQQTVRALSPSTFNGLSARSIAQSLHPSRATDKALIERLRAMGARLGYDAFAIQSALRRAGVPASRIACPTLVVAAQQDGLRSLDEAIELRDSIPGAVLEIVPDSGHMIPLEQPERLGALISRWVESVLGGPA
ncbi:MAG: alpha/beta fold hydrolase [Telluria sp.]